MFLVSALLVTLTLRRLKLRSQAHAREIRLLHETGRVFVLRMSAFALWYMVLFAGRCVFLIFSFVLPVLHGEDDIDAAGVTQISIEICATFVFFTLITEAVGDCHSAIHRIEETLLLARLEMPVRVPDDPTLQASAEAIERMLALLSHTRTHAPIEFCGMQSAGEFLRLMAGIAATCGGLAAAWLLSTATATVQIVDGS